MSKSLSPAQPSIPRTLAEIFSGVMERNGPCPLMHKEAGQWNSISTSKFYSMTAGIAAALRGWGISRGDRIAIISENRPEWTIADFAIALSGAVVVPLFPTLSADQTKFLLQDSGARAAFVSTKKQLTKLLSIAEETNIQKIVVMDEPESDRVGIDRPNDDRPDDDRPDDDRPDDDRPDDDRPDDDRPNDDRTGAVSVAAMHEIMGRGISPDPEFESIASRIVPADLASIIYTSGTTGIPKGVMLTHENLATNIAFSLREYTVGPGDISLSFLPLSHITARHVDFAVLYRGGTLAYVSSIDQLPAALKEIQPTFLVAVPRVYEKIHAQLEVKTKGFPKKWIYAWSKAVGNSHKKTILAGAVPRSPSWKLANRLIYSKLRSAMCARVKVFISGGAPLGYNLADWYATMGIRIHEGYGLTETSPVIAVNTPGAHKIGTVGRPLKNVEVRIADDGEILVRGPSIFQSYWKRPDETAAAFADGWFKTGDVGNLDADGFLSVTDRKKDLIKTSGGKFIAPQPIENSLKHNSLIAEAVVFGDQRKSAGVLIAPSFPVLEKWASENNVPFASRQELVEDPKVRTLYQSIVSQVNTKLADFEKLRKVLLLPEELRVEDGMLTASMKLRRRTVEEKYKHLIEKSSPAGAANA
jgi:long-chain acyl-CoA synthetase